MQVGSTLTLEKPQNGLAGLKHWRYDLVAGLVVSLVSLPFSLGIAVASGAPPICGLISAIIAGFVLPFLGGSYVTISGPAAGLAPALFAGMMLLGRGDLAVGYPLLLVAISLTGVVQVILAKFKLARFSAIFPTSVVEGMLASIGLLIIAKQLPLILGTKFEAHEFWGIVRETPSQLLKMDPKVFCLGIFCLALIFALASLKARWLKIVPPQVLAAVVGLCLGWFLGLDGDRLIHIPDQPFKHGIVLPDFYGVFTNHSLWWAVATVVLTLTLIDGVESLATIAAIDKIDPFRRKSDPNRTLRAMGISNLCSSLAGGLTIIPGGVKSTTSILTGGRTQWANFYNACFLVIYLLLGRNVINMLPYSALGAIVLFTGYKLCAPKVWKHVAHIGSEQLFVFATTVLVTVSTDLLWGIAAGIVAKLLLEAAIVMRVERGRPDGRESLGQTAKRWLGETGELFRNPVVKSVTVDDIHHLYFGRPLVCFNAMHLDAALNQIPSGAATVYLHVTDLVTLIDHTAISTLSEFVENFKRSGRGLAMIVGLDRLRARSHAETSMRISAPVLAQERAEALETLAKISLSYVSPGQPDPIAYLERISLTHIGLNAGQEEHPVNQAVARAWRYLARKTKDVLNSIRSLFVFDEAEVLTYSDHDLAWTSLSRIEQDTAPSEVEKLSLSSGEYRRPNIGRATPADHRLM
jgi:MFS superfamily sulfate permease-like transporter